MTEYDHAAALRGETPSPELGIDGEPGLSDLADLPDDLTLRIKVGDLRAALGAAKLTPYDHAKLVLAVVDLLDNWMADDSTKQVAERIVNAMPAAALRGEPPSPDMIERATAAFHGYTVEHYQVFGEPRAAAVLRGEPPPGEWEIQGVGGVFTITNRVRRFKTVSLRDAEWLLDRLRASSADAPPAAGPEPGDPEKLRRKLADSVEHEAATLLTNPEARLALWLLRASSADAPPAAGPEPGAEVRVPITNGDPRD